MKKHITWTLCVCMCFSLFGYGCAAMPAGESSYVITQETMDEGDAATLDDTSHKEENAVATETATDAQGEKTGKTKNRLYQDEIEELERQAEKNGKPLDENGLEYVDENGHEITEPLYDYYLKKARREMNEEHSYLRLGYMGHVSKDQSLEEVLERASKWESYEICSAIDKEHIYADRCDRENCDAFLVIPKYVSYVVISDYSIADIPPQPFWYESDDPDAIIFLTTADHMDPATQISIIDHDYGQAEIPLCFDVTTGQINTDCLMGIHDITPYEAFDSTEIPFYQQTLFDAVYYQSEIQKDMNRGKQMELLWESQIDGFRWAVWGIGDKPTDGDKTDYFAASRIDEDGRTHVMRADDMTGPWEEIE